MAAEEKELVVGVVFKAQQTLRTGDKYTGWWDNDPKRPKRHGNGTCIYNTGDVYSGGFKNDVRFGFGKLTQKNGDVYEGSWKGDVMDGWGTYLYKNGPMTGFKYRGGIKLGMRQGRGILEPPGAQPTYEGSWVEDKKQGKGMLKFPDGRVQHGEFHEDKMTRELEPWEIEEEFGIVVEEEEEVEEVEEKRSCASLFSWKGIKSMFGSDDDKKPAKKKKKKSQYKYKPGQPIDPKAGLSALRRAGVSAEAQTGVEEDPGERVVHAKTPEQLERISKAVRKHFLFRDCSQQQLHDVFDAMYEVHKSPGQGIIALGEEGDNFYIIDSGEVQVFKEDLTKPLASIQAGGAFGEIALMYSVPRTATVKASKQTRLWALDRKTFRRILVVQQSATAKMYEGFLNAIPILSPLSVQEKSELADALTPVEYKAGATIIKQGELGDSFYILEEGEARVTTQKKPGKGKHTEVAVLNRGMYFGEQALLKDEPRSANVIAKTKCRCLQMDRDTFSALLGPAEEALKADMKEREAQLRSASSRKK